MKEEKGSQHHSLQLSKSSCYKNKQFTHWHFS